MTTQSRGSLQGFKVTAIVECLVLEDEILVSKHGVRQFLKRYRSSGTILANCSVYVSLATIVRNRCNLGWIYHGSAYCQLIRNENKVKWLQWAQANLYDTFEDVIWSDETTESPPLLLSKGRGKTQAKTSS